MRSDQTPTDTLLEAILSGAVDAIITIDDRGNIDSANPATERLFGYPVDQLVGKNVSILMPSPYREEHDDYLSSYLKTGNKKIIGIGREVIGRRRDGTTFPMHLAVSEVQTDGRRMFTGIVRDITDLKEAEHRLERMNDELEQRVRERTAELHEAQAALVKKEKLATLGQVSGGIAHEIRNPLNAVKTSAFYLVNAKNLTREKMKEHLDRIDRQVNLINSVITALSDVAKMPDPKIEECAIVPLLRQVITSISLPPTVTVDMEAEDEQILVLVDENQIPIVFRNLIRNARDAMPQGGSLGVTIARDQASVKITISDDGVGIAPEQLARITEPLFSTKARGMGLGLAISLAILEKNRGSLEFTSELGKGSQFTVRLEPAS